MNHKFTLWPERLMTSAVGGGAEVTLTDTAKPEPRRGNSVLFLFFFLSFICAILFFGAVLCGCGPCHGCELLALRRLLCVANVRSAVYSRGAILTVGVAVSHLKLAAPFC